MKPLLTAKELADHLHVSVYYIWSMARKGILPHKRLPGGRRYIRFDLDEVMTCLEAKEKTPA